MVTYMQQSIEMHDSQYVVLPKWKSGEDAVNRSLTVPDVYVLDSTQKYPIGTKFVDGDRVWHYGYVNTDEDAGERAGAGLLNIADELVENTSAVIHAIGDTVISLVDSSSSLNLWAGGYVMLRPHPAICYRILSSTAHSSGACTVTLERGLIVAMLLARQPTYTKISIPRCAPHGLLVGLGQALWELLL